MVTRVARSASNHCNASGAPENAYSGVISASTEKSGRTTRAAATAMSRYCAYSRSRDSSEASSSAA
ncbi:hypothetical protein AB0E59_22010 [Lentzea sp. NPDC034063]|uniref:hypothetical protein n=1 Tax=unclassified Lentzea TaxID=2643253 RepID=UPI0033F2AE76